MINVPVSQGVWTVISESDTVFQFKSINDTYVIATESVDTPSITPSFNSNVRLIFPKREYEFVSTNGSKLYIYSPIQDINIIKDL